MTPPTWLDARGRRPARACSSSGRAVAPMRYRATDIRPHGWEPGRTLFIQDWCGCTTEYISVPGWGGWG